MKHYRLAHEFKGYCTKCEIEVADAVEDRVQSDRVCGVWEGVGFDTKQDLMASCHAIA